MYGTRPLQINRSPVIASSTQSKQVKNQFDPKTGYPLESVFTSNYNDSYLHRKEWDDPNYALPDENRQSHNNRGEYKDSSSQLESIFDAYGEYGNNYASEEGEIINQVQESDDESNYGPSPAVQPWDTRGKTGLFGGGGRGANDSETGWVQEFETTRSNSIWSQEGSEGGRDDDEEDNVRSSARKNNTSIRRSTEIYRSEVPQFSGGALRLLRNESPTISPTQHTRHSSSSTDHSSYGPETPVGSSSIPSKEFTGYPSSSDMSSSQRDSTDITSFYLPDESHQEEAFIKQISPVTFPRRPSRNVPPPLLAPLARFSPLQQSADLPSIPRPPETPARLRKLAKPSRTNKPSSVQIPVQNSVQTSPILQPQSIMRAPKSYLQPQPLHPTFLLPALTIHEPSPKQSNKSLPPTSQSQSQSQVKPVVVASSTVPVKKTNSFMRRFSKGKIPKISSPILPDGFVESLGMTTFALDLKNPDRNRQPLNSPTTEVPPPHRNQTIVPLGKHLIPINNGDPRNTSPRVPSPAFNSTRPSPRAENFDPTQGRSPSFSNQGKFDSTSSGGSASYRRRQSSSPHIVPPPPGAHPEYESRQENFSDNNTNRPRQKSIIESPWLGSERKNSIASSHKSHPRSPSVPQFPTFQQQQQQQRPNLPPSASTPSGFSDPWSSSVPRKQSFTRGLVPPPIAIPTTSYRNELNPSINSAPVRSTSSTNLNGGGEYRRPSLVRSQSAAATKTNFDNRNYSPGQYEQDSYQQHRQQQQHQQQQSRQYQSREEQSSREGGGKSSKNSSRPVSPMVNYDPSGPRIGFESNGKLGFGEVGAKAGERSSLASRPSHHYNHNLGGTEDDSGKWGEAQPPRRNGEEQWVPSWQ